MKYIAYKTATNDPSLPSGFITEHFETDQETLEGYNVVSLEHFNIIYQNNINLMRNFESQKGLFTVHPNTPAPVLRPASDVQQVPDNHGQPGNSPDNSPENAELFKQFLAWIAAGKPGNAPR